MASLLKGVYLILQHLNFTVDSFQYTNSLCCLKLLVLPNQICCYGGPLSIPKLLSLQVTLMYLCEPQA